MRRSVVVADCIDDKMNVVVAFAEIDEDCNSYVQAKTKLIKFTKT
jgi:hypothetical protein